MDFKKIKQLVSLVESSDISSLSVEEDQLKVEIKRDLAPRVSVASPIVEHQAVPVAPVVASPPADSQPTEPKKTENQLSIKSPMVGTFYEASSPDAKPFVPAGMAVKKGDVVCIIEAMKLFNEIEADANGTIEKVCINNGDPVELGKLIYFKTGGAVIHLAILS